MRRMSDRTDATPQIGDRRDALACHRQRWPRRRSKLTPHSRGCRHTPSLSAKSWKWSEFLDDFQRRWPMDENIYVDFVRDGIAGNGASRSGNPRWRRLTEDGPAAPNPSFTSTCGGRSIDRSHELTHIMQFIEVIHKLHDAFRACEANDRSGERHNLRSSDARPRGREASPSGISTVSRSN
jgi:hypothetical protein